MTGGGSERQLVYLATGLVRIGWDVDVALFRRGPNWEGLCRSGATIHEIPARVGYYPRLFLKISRLAMKLDPTAIQVWLPQMGLDGGLAAMASRTPWVFSERSSASAYPSGFRTRVRVALARRAWAVVSNS